MAEFCAFCHEKLTNNDGYVLFIKDKVNTRICVECQNRVSLASREPIGDDSPNAKLNQEKAVAFMMEALLSADYECQEAIQNLPMVKRGLGDFVESPIIATTGALIQNREIEKYLDVLSFDTIIGTGLISEVGMGLSDVVGKVSIFGENKVRQAKTASLKKLKDRAKEIGANAILGIEYDIYEFDTLFGVSATGTAVVLKDLGQ